MSNTKAVNEIIAIHGYISKHRDNSPQMSELSKCLDNLRRGLTTETTAWLAVDDEGTENIFQRSPKEEGSLISGFPMRIVKDSP